MNWMQKQAYRRTVIGEQVQAGDRVKIVMSKIKESDMAVSLGWVDLVKRIARNPAGVKVLSINGNMAQIAEDNPVGMVLGSVAVPLDALKHEQFGFLHAIGSSPEGGWEVMPDALDPEAWNVFYSGDLEFLGTADQALLFLKGHADPGDPVNVRNRAGQSSGVMPVGQVRLTDFVESLGRGEVKHEILGSLIHLAGERVLTPDGPGTVSNIAGTVQSRPGHLYVLLDSVADEMGGQAHPFEYPMEDLKFSGPGGAFTKIASDLGIEARERVRHESIDPNMEQILRAYGFEPGSKEGRWARRLGASVDSVVTVEADGSYELYDLFPGEDAPEKIASGKGSEELFKDLRSWLGPISEGKLRQEDLEMFRGLLASVGFEEISPYRDSRVFQRIRGKTKTTVWVSPETGSWHLQTITRDSAGHEVALPTEGGSGVGSLADRLGRFRI